MILKANTIKLNFCIDLLVTLQNSLEDLFLVMQFSATSTSLHIAKNKGTAFSTAFLKHKTVF